MKHEKVDRHELENESGQSLVLVALLMVGMVAFLGLLIDGGRDYAVRRQSQNASDASAFAGARQLTSRTSNSASEEQNILNAINTFALANGAASTSDVQAYFINSGSNQVGSQIGLNGGIPGSATGIKVNVTIRFNPFLMGVVGGASSVSSQTTAAAQSGQPAFEDHLLPMTLKDQSFNYNQNYQLFGNVTGSGGFQWLSFDCASSNPDLISYLAVNPTQSSGIVNVGDFICSGPGVQNSSEVNSVLDQWAALATPQMRYWTIPVYDYTTGNGSGLKYHIVSFAEFEFDGFNFNGSNKFVQGKFVKYGKLGHVQVPGSCNMTGANICGISLFQ